jgi:hypothetical protein
VRLAERLVALHRALDRGNLPHAFGGAIALAYCTLDPRGTSDIDVNVFIPVSDHPRLLKALPAGVACSAEDVRDLERDGQVRLWWDGTPVDLFLDYAPVHTDAAVHRRIVEFEGTEIPVLGPIELAVFKAMFDRTKDWADIEAMIAANTLDVDAVRKVLHDMLGSSDPRLDRLDEAERRTTSV